jgi:hypothetical protein
MSEPEVDKESQSSSAVTPPSPPAEVEESAPYPIDLPSPLLLATLMALAIDGTGTCKLSDGTSKEFTFHHFFF